MMDKASKSKGNKNLQASNVERRRRNTGRVTVKDVADLAKVGAITVSRAMRTPEAVSETLRKRIDAAIDELGYVPNRIAGSLASVSTRIIPVVVPSLSNAIFSEVLYGIQDVLEDKGFQILITNTDYSQRTEEKAVRALLEWAPGGIILVGVDHTGVTRRLVSRARIPVVEVMDLSDDPINVVVGFSHIRGGFEVTRYLLDKGYRRIAFVGTRMNQDQRIAKRLKGCQEALASVGFSPAIVRDYPVQSSYRLGGQALLELLRDHSEVDAVFFANDDLAVGAVQACVRHKIPVPGRVAITGFNGLEIGQVISPRLTTVLIPRLEIGRFAAEKILQRINGEEEPKQITDLGFEILEGETT